MTWVRAGSDLESKLKKWRTRFARSSLIFPKRQLARPTGNDESVRKFTLEGPARPAPHICPSGFGIGPRRRSFRDHNPRYYSDLELDDIKACPQYAIEVVQTEIHSRILRETLPSICRRLRRRSPPGSRTWGRRPHSHEGNTMWQQRAALGRYMKNANPSLFHTAQLLTR
jgi:hypothetical protein